MEGKFINKEEFNELNESIGIFNVIVHEKGNINIDNNEDFTLKVERLRNEILFFENRTGMKLNVTIEEGRL